MGDIICRFAAEEDLPRVAELYEQLDAYFRTLSYNFPRMDQVGQLWVDSFRRTLGRFSILAVAEQDGELVGFALSRIKRVAPYLGGMLVGELSDIWVDPAARRGKTGERLARLTFEWLQQQGVHSIEAQVLEGNDASKAFFRSLGFFPELTLYRWIPQASPETNE
jgi:ribosomal protein S18 acetylase RimI-like enzyme